jgi:hypothetical protein
MDLFANNGNQRQTTNFTLSSTQNPPPAPQSQPTNTPPLFTQTIPPSQRDQNKGITSRSKIM